MLIGVVMKRELAIFFSYGTLMSVLFRISLIGSRRTYPVTAAFELKELLFVLLRGKKKKSNYPTCLLFNHHPCSLVY